jgi:hypothetical protein
MERRQNAPPKTESAETPRKDFEKILGSTKGIQNATRVISKVPKDIQTAVKRAPERLRNP